jgi:hypothetical protein
MPRIESEQRGWWRRGSGTDARNTCRALASLFADGLSVGPAVDDVACATVIDDVLLSWIIVALVFGVALTWGGR